MHAVVVAAKVLWSGVRLGWVPHQDPAGAGAAVNAAGYYAPVRQHGGRGRVVTVATEGDGGGVGSGSVPHEHRSAVVVAAVDAGDDAPVRQHGDCVHPAGEVELERVGVGLIWVPHQYPIAVA